MPKASSKKNELSPADIRILVKKHLPAWLKACAAAADTIVMHDQAFGTSADELFLLGCALKHAAISGKAVHVICGDEKPAPRWKVKAIAVEAIFREKNLSRTAPRARSHAPTRHLHAD